MKINLKNAQIVETEVKSIKNKPAKLVFISDGHNWLISQKQIYHAMEKFETARNRFKHIPYNDDDLLLTKKVAKGLYPQLTSLFENNESRLRLVCPKKVVKTLNNLADKNSKAYINCIQSKRVQKLVCSVKPRALSAEERIHKLQAKLDAANARADQLEYQNAHEFNNLDAAREEMRDKEIEYHRQINKLSDDNLKLRTNYNKLNDDHLALKVQQEPKKLTRWAHLKAFFVGEVE